MEHDNQRQSMVSHQSITTPPGVAEEWYGVHDMKNEAMDEAYGMAGKKGCESSYHKAKSQFRDYNWA
jgi:hypothetical protein